MEAVAFLFAAAVFGRSGRLERAIRLLFVSSGVLGIGALIYGYELEYRYEVAAILINWITLIVSGVLLNLLFKRRLA